MQLTGSFGVMSVTDLLQWIMTARKTGCLQVHRHNVSRSIFCRDGHVVACSSADPLVLLGQFLLYHGWISESTLKQALQVQETSKENLGNILVDMGAIRQDQLLQVVASKAMETIHGLFDWDDATFEFVPEIQPTPDTIQVDLEIQEILLEGVGRQDEMKMIREVFPSTDLVPTTTAVHPDGPTLASPMAKRIYEAIDGTRSLSEIMLSCRASEFRVCQFLHRLHEVGMISVEGTRDEPVDSLDPTSGVERAEGLIEQGETAAAFDLLQQLAREHPGNIAIKSFLAKVELRLIQAISQGALPPEAIPVACEQPQPALPESLSAEERYLLKLVDGERDVKSIVWIAPMTLAEILRGLEMLIDQQLIRIDSSDPNSRTAVDSEENRPV